MGIAVFFVGWGGEWQTVIIWPAWGQIARFNGLADRYLPGTGQIARFNGLADRYLPGSGQIARINGLAGPLSRKWTPFKRI
ncbi:hypothetical protein [Cohnella sp.]|uniref:hypothetical protein n=1 Tax=Cohnella sp. TaxID=1883426 RepID=UPI003565D663